MRHSQGVRMQYIALSLEEKATITTSLAISAYNEHPKAHMGPTNEIIRVRLCYAKHQRHRVAHEVVAGPGYRHMSVVVWMRILVKLRLRHGEKISVDSPILVRHNGTTIVPMTGQYMMRMDKIYAPKLGWQNATIHSRRRGFATAVVYYGTDHDRYETLTGSHDAIRRSHSRRQSSHYHKASHCSL